MTDADPNQPGLLGVVQPETVEDQAQPAPEGDPTPVEPVDGDFPAGEWPEAQFRPAQPQFSDQPGARLKVWTNVAIFGLDARQEGELFDVPEVRAAAANGLIEIRGEVVDDDAPAEGAPETAQDAS